jgi:hypothetical protein
MVLDSDGIDHWAALASLQSVLSVTPLNSIEVSSVDYKISNDFNVLNNIFRTIRVLLV